MFSKNLRKVNYYKLVIGVMGYGKYVLNGEEKVFSSALQCISDRLPLDIWLTKRQRDLWKETWDITDNSDGTGKLH